MPSVRTGGAIVALALLPLVAIVAMWQFGPGEPLISFGSEAPRAAHGASSVGASRNAKLKLLTEQYVALDDGISAGMRSGAEFAPMEFLNRELQREGSKWRVRKVEGLVADTYDIS
ncbi:MAG: hypothetical protein H6917_05525 [Novosphingobium sp.]|nr:hypothetical protein [Novosphingobium sp.]MCP5401829.1 hypothetical protein [Novosphingobium sp.]